MTVDRVLAGRRSTNAEVAATPNVAERLGIVVDYSAEFYRPYFSVSPSKRPDGRPAGWYRQTGVADCGHRFDNLSDDGLAGMDSGYSIGSAGRTFCYPCTDRLERARALLSDTIDGYLSADGRTITTWTGGRLADVVSAGSSASGWHGSAVWSVRARTEDGREFYGRNAGAGRNIRLRAVKGHRVEAGA
jgi:hypothetical protein